VQHFASRVEPSCARLAQEIGRRSDRTQRHAGRYSLLCEMLTSTITQATEWSPSRTVEATLDEVLE
jgi:hypothetical protein